MLKSKKLSLLLGLLSITIFILPSFYIFERISANDHINQQLEDIVFTPADATNSPEEIDLESNFSSSRFSSEDSIGSTFLDSQHATDYIDDDFEENDNQSTAAKIHGTPCTHDLFYLDEDHFEIYLKKSWNYSITITFDNTTIDLNLYLRDNSSSLLKKSESTNSQEVIIYQRYYNVEDDERFFLSVIYHREPGEVLDPSPYVLTISMEVNLAPFPIYSTFILVLIVFGIFRKRRKRRMN